MNLLRIEAFLAVAETRNISRAAAQLEVAQSVLSRHIRALEEEIGCRLFERTGRGVALTDAAQQLAPRLRSALDEMRRATAEAAETAGQPSGVVRLGVVPAAAHPLVGLLYQRISTRFPRIALQFFEGFSNPLEDKLAAGDIDLAVLNRYGRAQHRGEERLCVVDSYVIGPPGAFHPQGRDMTFKQLAQLPLVLAPRPNVLRLELDLLCRRAGVQLRVLVEAHSLLIMKDLILRSGLYTLLPRQAVYEELAHGLLDAARLVSPGLPRTLSLLSSPRGPGSAATRAVSREIREIVQASLLVAPGGTEP
jgi:LysR family nitrogen assimilation transcriptional regulator